MSLALLAGIAKAIGESAKSTGDETTGGIAVVLAVVVITGMFAIGIWFIARDFSKLRK